MDCPRWVRFPHTPARIEDGRRLVGSLACFFVAYKLPIYFDLTLILIAGKLVRKSSTMLPLISNLGGINYHLTNKQNAAI